MRKSKDQVKLRYCRKLIRCVLVTGSDLRTSFGYKSSLSQDTEQRDADVFFNPEKYYCFSLLNYQVISSAIIRAI